MYFCLIGTQNTMPSCKKYTPLVCVFSDFAGLVSLFYGLFYFTETRRRKKGFIKIQLLWKKHKQEKKQNKQKMR